jgi:hypothetical protein
MSSNIKYIGLDVHKEAISIAVLNGSGRSTTGKMDCGHYASWRGVIR